MIGSAAALLGAVGALGLAAVLGAGGPDPGLALASRNQVSGTAAVADRALERLEAALQPGLSAARTGAAAVIAGDEFPGPLLAGAADELRAAVPALDDARDGLASVDAVHIAFDPTARPIPFGVTAAELASIAGQLDAATEAADAFVAMRLRAERLAGRLEDAFAALADGDLETADGHIRTARADLEALERWDVDFVTLPVWIETTDAMIASMERIVSATRADDAAGAATAADDFARAADDAASADRALRIALGEGGSAVTAAPLGRLAEVLRAVGAARAEVATIVQTVAR